MSVHRRIEEIPMSVEAIRRKVMMAIHAVERETAVFLERYIGNVGEPATWPGFIGELCERTGKSSDKLDDYKDLDHILGRYKLEPEYARQAAFIQLRRLVERGRMFEYIAFSLRNDLVDAYEKQLQKYCLSFEAESRGRDLKSVREYENRIIKSRKDISEKLAAVDAMLDECDRYKSPFVSQYIAEYESVLRIMEQTCHAMVRACEPMKRWVMHDSTYANKVQDEINMFNRRKMELRDVLKQLEYQRDQLGLKLRRRAFFALKMERNLQDVRDEKRQLKRREALIKENMDKVYAESERKKRDLEEVRGKITTRQDNSPTVYNYLTGMAETLRADIWKLDSKLEVLDHQKLSLVREQIGVTKRIDQVAVGIESSNRQRDEALARVTKYETDIRLIRDDIRGIDSKVASLKRIREIKLHSDTVKKIFHFGYNPGQITEIKDELQEAFKLTADDMGKDWVWLYQKLPFVPPRDYRERSHDIEVIDLSNRRVDDGKFHVLALKSLEKWRRLSTSASVPTLIDTLRRLRRPNLVRKLQYPGQRGPGKAHTT